MQYFDTKARAAVDALRASSIREVANAAFGREDILSFWFGEPGEPPLARAERWFAKDDAFDAQIRERFGATLDPGSVKPH